MRNVPEENEQDIHIIHNGKFYFSIFEGRRPSWCDLKVLQGKYKTLAILSQPQGYIGTFISIAIKHLVAQISNLFGLDPATTIYLHYTPPYLLMRGVHIWALDDCGKTLHLSEEPRLVR